MRKLQKLRLGRVVLLSKHPVLDQVARDILAGLCAENLPDRRITVYVGLHRNYGLHALRPGRRLAIQTEHYFDADGRPMWRRMKRWRSLKAVLLNHLVLDLSPANRPHYDFMPGFLRRRVLFGPHIFPCNAPAFQPGETSAFLFFGEMSDRRRALLAALPEGVAQVAPPATFGADLAQMVARAGGILNLHYAEGRYSEMPRLLSACLAGKVVMSEPLGDELVMGRDYLPPGPVPDAAVLRQVHAGFWQNVAAPHGFARFLRRHFG